MLEELRVAPAVGRKAIFDWSIGLEIIWLMRIQGRAQTLRKCEYRVGHSGRDPQAPAQGVDEMLRAKFRGPFEPDQVSTEPAAFASSTGSVWAYFRITDKICFLTLVLVFLPAAHFVDDFYYSQPSRSSVPNVLLAAAATTRAFIFWLEAMAQIACLMIASQVLSGYSKDPALTNLLGCHKKDPEFDQAWELLFELTKKPMDPDKPLSEKLVKLEQVGRDPFGIEVTSDNRIAEKAGQDDLDFSPVRKDGQDAGMSFVTGVTTPPSSLD
ncbi:unnamed protein product, partial [Symbiodinium necroappetens]